MWEDDVIKPEFGILVGVSKESVKVFIHNLILSGRKYFNERQLIAKAKASIKDSMVLLACCKDFTKAVGFPLGKNEKDALLFCAESLNTEHDHNIVKENGTDEDEDDDKDPPVTQGPAPTQPLRNSRVVDSDNEDAEDENEDNDSVEYVSERKFAPQASITFMILGPYDVA